MSTPTLSIVIPTRGRPHLAATLASIRQQADRAAVEILVVGDTYQDTFADALAAVPALCRQYQARYLGHDGGVHQVGHPQRTAGDRAARGAWLTHCQDDSIWLPGAWAAIQASLAADKPGPRLFQVDTWQAGVVWRTQKLEVGNVDADCLVVPRDPSRLPPWPHSRYEADYDHIAATVALWAGAVRWEPVVLSRGRPAQARVA